jgi:pyrimidine-nucleoside phosphorylase
MRTDLDPERFAHLVAELGACFGSQTADIVPADRRLYALRDATATVESIPLIVSSILSKKFAEGIRGVVIDVKCGSGAFTRTFREARELSSALEATGSVMEIPVKTIITTMDEPLGLAVGNALEVEEAIRILEGRGPADAVALTHRLVAEMLLLGGLVEDLGRGEVLARGAVESGHALERFVRIVSAQGGRLEMTRAGYGLPRAPVMRPLTAGSGGFVSRIDARAVGETVRALGGGRFRTDDSIDPRVGIILRKKCGDEVAAGEVLLEIHASRDEAAERAERSLIGAIDVSREPVERAPLVLTDD